MVSVRLIDICKNYAEIKILEHINWEITEGELMVLVGPSGCGKTTLLKIILGSLKPNSGNIYFNQELINDISISQRNIGFVPQNFGLFPHLNVIENLSFGMKMHKSPQDKVNVQVSKLIKMLRLKNLELRKPNQLSWGQQQRVALARALAIEPSLLLLDEPLSSVDWVARREITEEINRLQKNLKITSIYVTHDIDEAFDIGDKITVMNAGRIEQSASSEDLIKNPKNKFVSDYIGHSQNIKRRQALM
jgi:ABC-type sugar transport system ATPase subunit